MHELKVNQHKILLVVSPYYNQITDDLLAGFFDKNNKILSTQDAKLDSNTKKLNLKSFEIPLDIKIEKTKEKYSNSTLTFDVLEVPGALEIPLAIKMGIIKEKYSAFIALGCVIRGETSHYNIVANNSSYFLSQLSITYSAIILNGILTVENFSQAKARAYNKGKYLAKALDTMLKLKAEI